MKFYINVDSQISTYVHKTRLGTSRFNFMEHDIYQGIRQTVDGIHVRRIYKYSQKFESRIWISSVGTVLY